MPIAGTFPFVECKKDTYRGEIENMGKSQGEFRFEECGDLLLRNSSHAKEVLGTCEIESPITFKTADQLVVGPGGATEDEILPEIPPRLVKIKINTCATFKGTYEIKGNPGQRCALPEGEIEKISHEIICTSTGSKITFGQEPMSLENTERIGLATGEKFRS